MFSSLPVSGFIGPDDEGTVALGLTVSLQSDSADRVTGD